MTTTVLSLHSIGKSFPGVQALQNVDLTIAAAEVHALLGENGAGKSTLIKIISGVYPPDEGTLEFDGQPRRWQRPADAQFAGVATIYQELLLYPDLSVAENIFMGHAPTGRFGLVDWRQMRREARAILKSLNIEDLDVDRPVGALSVGNRQRIEIAKALSQNARLLIMDEPTAALTEADIAQLFPLVRLLRERGVAIIYISHRMEEIFELADRVSVLRDGQLIGTENVAATDRDALIAMMVGRRIKGYFPHVSHPPGGPVLRTRDLTRNPTTQAVTLTLRSREIVGLAGLVGSGRSELAQTLFGITPAQSGTIEIAGETVRINSPQRAAELGIAYVPEDRGLQGLIRPLSIAKNLSLANFRTIAPNGIINEQAERQLAINSIARFSIRAQDSEQIVEQLSGGNQQKVVLAKWLASEPKVLILDEPTRGIDVGAKAEIHALINELADNGLAILLISSELPEVIAMSDRILVMRDGQHVAEFPRAAADQEQVVRAMMGASPAAPPAHTLAHSVKAQ